VKNYLFGLLSYKQNSAGQRCNETDTQRERILFLKRILSLDKTPPLNTSHTYCIINCLHHGGRADALDPRGIQLGHGEDQAELFSVRAHCAARDGVWRDQQGDPPLRNRERNLLLSTCASSRAPGRGRAWDTALARFNVGGAAHFPPTARGGGAGSGDALSI
jgi:hypothetical protein